jgi:Secretion system C-terminal sorting domain/WD40-like Beta Propeller Repeat
MTTSPLQLIRSRFALAFLFLIALPVTGFAQLPPLWAVESGTGLIYELDIYSGAVLRSFPTPVATHVPGGGGPEGLAYDGVTLYFTSGNVSETGTGLGAADNRTIHYIDPATGVAFDSFLLPPASGSGAMDQAIDALATDGTLLYANRPSDMEILVVNPATKTVVRTIPIGFAEVGGMGFNAYNGMLYVSDATTHTVHLVDPATGVSTGTFSYAPGSGGILGLDFVHNKMFVTLNHTPEIIDTSPVNGIKIWSLPSPTGLGLVSALAGSPPAIHGTCDANVLYSVDSSTSTISAYDPATGSVLRTFLAPTQTYPPGSPANLGGPEGLAFDGTVLYYISGDDPGPFQSDTIYTIDPCTGAVLSMFVPPWPAPGSGVDPTIDGLGFGRYLGSDVLFAMRPATDEIFVIDPATGTITATVVSTAPIVGGLGWHNLRQTFFVSDFGATPSLLHEVDPATGNVIGTFPMPPTGPLLGVDFVGTRLFAALDDGIGTINEYDLSGALLGTFPSVDFMPSALAGPPADPLLCGPACYDIYAASFGPGVLAGAPATQITGGRAGMGEFNVTFSPDGSTMLYDGVVNGSQHLYTSTLVAPAATGVSTSAVAGPPVRVRSTRNGNNATWSPNGRKIMFDRAPVENSIFVVRPTRRGRSGFRADAVDPDYSPNGKCVVFTDAATGAVMSRRVKNGLEEMIAPSGNTPVWSPKGNQVVYEDGGNLYRVKVSLRQCTALRRPTRLTNKGKDGAPDVSPDGATIAFHSRRRGSYRIWTMPMRGGTPTRLSGIPGHDSFDPAWSTDGSSVFFSGYSEPGLAPPAVGRVAAASLMPELEMAAEQEFRTGPEEVSIGAYPNPFNPSTTLRYELPAAAQVQLAMFDVLGRRVALLVDGRVDSGVHEVRFDAANLPSGVYLYRMQASGVVYSGRVMLIK